MLRRPLLLPTVGLMAGVALAEYWMLPLAGAWIAAGLALIAQGWTAAYRGSAVAETRRSIIAACVTAFTLGALAHRLGQSVHSASDVGSLTPVESTIGELRAEFLETPALRLAERSGRWVARTAVRVRLTAWRPANSTWQPATGNVLLTMRGALPPQGWRGRSFEASGVMETPGSPEAPGLFDYGAYLRHQEIHRVFRVATTNDLHLATVTGAIPWSERFLPWAHTVLARGLPDDESSRLLRAMTLGWQTPLSGEVDDVFMRAGTMHVFAISGLHIALLAAMVVQLFRAFRLPRAWAGALALPLTWGYVAATGWQPSAVRSAVMASVILGSVMLQRPTDLLNSLAAAADLILLQQPGQLFQSGFQLSFGAVTGLAVLVPPLERQFTRWIAGDPWLPETLRPGWQKRVIAAVRPLIQNLAVGVGALLASIPLIVHHFHLFSPVSLLANLIVVPLSSLALAATSASLAVAPLAPWLSEIFNASGWLWMHEMILLSRWFADWPGGWFSVAAPPWPWWLGWYGALGLAWETERTMKGAIVRAGMPQNWYRGLLVVIGLWLMAAICCCWSFQTTPRIFVFRQGPGIFVHSIFGNALFDGGRAGAGQQLILPFLRANGVNQLDIHQVSQGLQRFCGVGTELLKDLPPKQVWRPPLAPSHQPLLRQYLTNLFNRHIPVESARYGSQVAGWSVIAPRQVPKGTRAMDHAPVLRIDLGGVRILWLGATGTSVVKDLLQRPQETGADVVIVVANAPMDPLPEDLLAAIDPRLAIVVVAAFPAAAQLAPAVRTRLAHASYPVLFTDELGGIELTFSRGNLRWHGYGGRGSNPTGVRKDAPVDYQKPIGELEIESPRGD